MTEAVKEYAKRYAAEQSMMTAIKCKVSAIKNMLADDIPLEKALAYESLDQQTYEKYANADEEQATE